MTWIFIKKKEMYLFHWVLGRSINVTYQIHYSVEFITWLIKSRKWWNFTWSLFVYIIFVLGTWFEPHSKCDSQLKSEDHKIRMISILKGPDCDGSPELPSMQQGVLEGMNENMSGSAKDLHQAFTLPCVLCPEQECVSQWVQYPQL